MDSVTLKSPEREALDAFLGMNTRINLAIRTTTLHSASEHWPLPMVRKKSPGVTLQKSADAALQH
jgi:hypothetical protein